jgi:hypothetical protein
MSMPALLPMCVPAALPSPLPARASRGEGTGALVIALLPNPLICGPVFTTILLTEWQWHEPYLFLKGSKSSFPFADLNDPQ